MKRAVVPILFRNVLRFRKFIRQVFRRPRIFGGNVRARFTSALPGDRFSPARPHRRAVRTDGKRPKYLMIPVAEPLRIALDAAAKVKQSPLIMLNSEGH